MKAMNTMRLCFDSRSCNEAFARTAVAAFLCGLDPTVEELSDVKTAVSEAVTNCIVHGYRSRIDKVYLTATIGIKPKDTAPWVVIRIRDKGCGIEDVHMLPVVGKRLKKVMALPMLIQGIDSAPVTMVAETDD